jgi:hypothetical protein
LLLLSSKSPVAGSSTCACSPCVAAVSGNTPTTPAVPSALEAWHAAHSTGLTTDVANNPAGSYPNDDSIGA